MEGDDQGKNASVAKPTHETKVNNISAGKAQQQMNSTPPTVSKQQPSNNVSNNMQRSMSNGNMSNSMNNYIPNDNQVYNVGNDRVKRISKMDALLMTKAQTNRVKDKMGTMVKAVKERDETIKRMADHIK